MEDKLAELTAKVEALEAIVVDKDAEISELSAKVENMSKPVAAPSKGGSNLPEFTFDKKKYRFTAARFKLDGVVYTAADAVKDKDVLTKLVTIGAGVIKAL